MDDRTKIFISCGQSKGTQEVEIADKVKKAVESAGFYGYLAFRDSTLEGLKNNIYRHLETSDYFIFIDHCRERLEGSSKHRGSLFCNQELALASYLGLEVLGFQQSDVKELDGILGSIQLNPVNYDELDQLPALVLKSIEDNNWEHGWKNRLQIYRDATEYDSPLIPEPRTYYHLQIENEHRSKIAKNCFGYLHSIKDTLTKSYIRLRTAELKWAGYTFPFAAIMPDSKRELDAFYVKDKDPKTLHFSCFSDTSYHMRPIEGPGVFELRYVVVSDNFPLADAIFTVNIHHNSEGIEFY